MYGLSLSIYVVKMVVEILDIPEKDLVRTFIFNANHNFFIFFKKSLLWFMFVLNKMFLIKKIS
jgi:hypothetical protein